MLSLLLGLFISIFSFEKPKPENLCGIMYPWPGEQNWGDGAIPMNTPFQIELWADTMGTKFGKMEYVPKIKFKIFDKNGIDFNKYVWFLTASDNNLLPLIDINSETYYKCSWLKDVGEFYLRKSDMQNQNILYHPFEEVIFLNGFGLKHASYPRIGVNIPNTCLNIRKGPGTNYVVIGCIHSNELNPIGESRIELIERKGLWAKVHVVNLYYEGPDLSNDPEIDDWDACPNTIKSELTGWMKIVNEKGFPKIWFTMGGY